MAAKKLLALMVMVSALLLCGCTQPETREFTEGNFHASYPALEEQKELPAGTLLRAEGKYTYEISAEQLSGGFAETVEAGLAEFYALGDAEILRKEINQSDATIEYAIDFGEGEVVHAVERGIECNGRIYWVSILGFKPEFNPQDGEIALFLNSAGCGK